MDPPARYDRRTIETCPCGWGEHPRNCKPEEDGSDPNRSQVVTTYEAGSTVPIVFQEYIGHGGRFRIAFDEDGADLEDFNQHVLLDVMDPPRVRGNINQNTWQLEVTLPDTPCDNCTLQVIQVLNADTQTPIADPAELSTYYACADIVLVPSVEREPGAAAVESSEGSGCGVASRPRASRGRRGAERGPWLLCALALLGAVGRARGRAGSARRGDVPTPH